MACPDCASLAALMEERDRRYLQRFEAQEMALELARLDTQHWRANANEWRAAMNDRDANFLSKSLGTVIGVLSLVSILVTLFLRVKI